MKKKPPADKMTSGFSRLPTVNSVVSLATTIPMLFSAIRPRKKPIPAEMAIFCERGMLSTIQRRTGKSDKITQMTPEMNTAPSAICHG